MARRPAPHRTDGNQAAIVEALRAVGATVQDIHVVGYGCPDLLVSRGGVTYLLECKAPGEGLNPGEASWHALWRGPVAIVHDECEALAAVGVALA